MPDRPDFGGGATTTTIHPLVLVGMLVAMLLIMAVPRRFVMVPVLFGIFLTPLGQQVYALGVHWLVFRLIVLCGLLRAAILKSGSRKPLLVGGLNRLDKAFVFCVAAQFVSVNLLFMESQAFVNQIGFLIDFLGTYFVLRICIHDEEDIYTALKCMSVLALIMAAVMIREQRTLQNAFGLLGGVPLVSEIRDGKIRSRAVFQHPLTAGVFGGTLLPLFVMLWRDGRAKIFAAMGAIGSTAMTVCANSSSPLLAYVAGLTAIALWPLRPYMKTVRFGLVFLLGALQLFMNAPVWMVIARVDLTGSSSGYHRAQLVDMFIRHFGDWWLIGTKDTGSWGIDIWDAQNQYVSVGEAGGLVAFIFFIALITRACARIGNARRAVQRSSKEWFVWLLGAALFSNLVAFFGVNYFDQVKVAWFLLLAVISAATGPLLDQAVESPPQLSTDSAAEHFSLSNESFVQFSS